MLLKIVNVVTFLAMVFTNYLANALPINDKTTGQLSAQYPNLFVPAGFTFSIWGIIYLLLTIFVVIQFFENNKPVVRAIGWAFALSSLFNTLWIVAWHYERLPLSVLIMLGLLVCLVYIGLQIRTLPVGIIKAAFGIYLGWISIATIANITALLVNYQWGGWGISDQNWTIILIAAGLIIAALTMIRVNNPFLGIAVIWAFAGIVANRAGSHPAIVTAAFIAIALMTLFTVAVFLKRFN